MPSCFLLIEKRVTLPEHSAVILGSSLDLAMASDCLRAHYGDSYYVEKVDYWDSDHEEGYFLELTSSYVSYEGCEYDEADKAVYA